MQVRVRVVIEVVKSKRVLLSLHHVNCLACVKLPPGKSSRHVRLSMGYNLRKDRLGSAAKGIIIRYVTTMDGEL